MKITKNTKRKQNEALYNNTKVSIQKQKGLNYKMQLIKVSSKH